MKSINNKTYKMIRSLFNSFLLLIISSFLFSSCGKNNNSASHEDEHGHEGNAGHENALTTSLTAEQIKSIGIQLGGIENKQLTASLKANGVLKVPNQNRATITTMAGGVVKSILVQPGTAVNKGQIIATIAGTAFITMQEEYISINSKVQLAEIDYSRQKELQAGNATSLKTLQQSESELKALKARKSSLQKQLELVGVNASNLTSENIQSHINVSSPIKGSVSEVMVNIGSFIEANNPVATIVDNSQLHLDLYIYEKDLIKLREGQTIHFTLTNNPGKEYDAKIYAISNTFESNTKALSVHAQVLGDKTGLIDGMSITAIVSLEEVEVNAVPSDAIVSFEGQDYIFIVTDSHNEAEHHSEDDGHKHDEHGHEHKDGEKHDDHGDEKAHAEKPENEKGMLTFERIPVVKGTSDVGYSEITLLKNIPTNSQIVTKGAFFVLGKMTNSGEGHSH